MSDTFQAMKREQLELRLAELRAERTDLLREQPLLAEEQGDPADHAEELVERETTEAVVELLDARIRVVERHLAELDRFHIHSV